MQEALIAYFGDYLSWPPLSAVTPPVNLSLRLIDKAEGTAHQEVEGGPVYPQRSGGIEGIDLPLGRHRVRDVIGLEPVQGRQQRLIITAEPPPDQGTAG
jgi:hypothetical protein